MNYYDMTKAQKDIVRRSWGGMVGTISSLIIRPSAGLNVLVVETDQGTWTWEPYGECCAYAHILNDDTTREAMAKLEGQVIAKCYVVNRSAEEGYDQTNGIESSLVNVLDVAWYTIESETDKVHIVLHVEHNGYYGGQLTLAKFEPKKEVA